MEFDWSLVFRFEALVERLNVSFPDRSSREVSTDKSGPVTRISLIPDIVGGKIDDVPVPRGECENKSSRCTGRKTRCGLRFFVLGEYFRLMYFSNARPPSYEMPYCLPPLEQAIQVARPMFGLRRRCCHCWHLFRGSLLPGTDRRKSDTIKNAGNDHQRSKPGS